MNTRFIFCAFFLVFLSALPSPLRAEENPRVFDYLFLNASVYDGQSYRSVSTDVGIIGDYIAQIGDLQEYEAFNRIDLEGLVLAPGFIDTHTHSDFNPLVYPDLANKITQGVTTEVIGNCGMSAAPVWGGHERHLHGVWAREGVQIPTNIEWKSYNDYRRHIERTKLFNNWVGLIGHGNIRSAVMGVDPRPAGMSEILEMKKRVAEAMKEGASGISFGLVYLPGLFAEEEELVELCREAAKHSGICAFHMRSEGSALIEALEEAIRIGRKAQARVQISHLKVGGGKKNWPLIQKAFEVIERARVEGVEVSADVYPYTAGFAELGVILPDSLYSRTDRVDLFRDPLKKFELLEELREHYENRRMRWDWIAISSSPVKKYRKYEGKTIRDIALMEDIEPEKFLIDILGDTRFEVSAFYFSQSEKVMREVLKKSYVSIGSDSIADGSRRPHPRAFASFPKVLRKYVREERELKLGEAIHKMTALPAKQFRIHKRGLIQTGYYADLVVFDPEKIADQADYENPTKENVAIEWVFLNGKPVVKKGRTTGERVGRFLTLR